MKNPSVGKKLRAGETVLCTRVAYQDPDLLELIARMGIDCAWLCTEHVRMDPSLLRSLIRAAVSGGAEALVRLKPSTYAELIQVLEMGATGIMIPWIESAEEVREVVRQAKFHPQGRRGYDGSHVDAEYGLIPMTEYLRRANEETFIVAQIETPAAVENLEEIAQVEGVDVLFLGPNDLSINLGIPGEVAHEKILNVAGKLVEVCRRHGKAAGVTCASTEAFERYRKLGFRFISYGSDYRMIRNGYENLIQEVRHSGFR